MGIFDINYTLLLKFVIFKSNCEGKYKIFWNIQKYFILQMKISNFINYFTTCVQDAFTLH
jgi:hypothetical protein